LQIATTLRLAMLTWIAGELVLPPPHGVVSRGMLSWVCPAHGDKIDVEVRAL